MIGRDCHFPSPPPFAVSSILPSPMALRFPTQGLGVFYSKSCGRSLIMQIFICPATTLEKRGEGKHHFIGHVSQMKVILLYLGERERGEGDVLYIQ